MSHFYQLKNWSILESKFSFFQNANLTTNLLPKKNYIYCCEHPNICINTFKHLIIDLKTEMRENSTYVSTFA